MRAFLSEEKSLLIVTPFRCGSTYLSDNASKFKLRSFDFHQENLPKNIENKIFIYRDPLERYLSLYHKFCFGQNGHNQGEMASILSNLLSTEKNQDFWEEVYLSMPQLERNFQRDPHIHTQYSYFTATNENIDSYRISSVKKFREVIYLNFAEKVLEHKTKIDSISINYKTIIYLNEIQNVIKKIYQDDYSKIQPRLMTL
jgi:hypothetical protein